MTKRILDACASDFAAMDASALFQSIKAAAGRTVAAEVICTDQCPVDGVTHGEIAAGMGADIITLDRYDCLQPMIQGLPQSMLESDAPLAAYKQLLGRPLGVNFIVVEAEPALRLGGRFYTPENAQILMGQGPDIVFLYGRPGQGGTFEKVLQVAEVLGGQYGQEVLLVGVPSLFFAAPRNEAGYQALEVAIRKMITAGCSGIALPMPGTKQGWMIEPTRRLVDAVHALDALSWLLITGSLEGGPEQVIYDLALQAKMISADAVRLDEAGLSGMPKPTNILKFSLALRGERHTFRRMAFSDLR